MIDHGKAQDAKAASRPTCLLAGNAYVFSIRRAAAGPNPEKGGNPMALTICWLDDLAKAKDHARQTKKPVLLDFFNPQRIGCQQMGAVTYPNDKVIKFVDYNFVPVQIETSNTALMNQFNVKWTPTIIVLDADGNEVHREVGVLAPEEFIPTFMVGKGKFYFNAEAHPEAQGMFDEALKGIPQQRRGGLSGFFPGGFPL